MAVSYKKLFEILIDRDMKRKIYANWQAEMNAELKRLRREWEKTQ
jgi:hypothetical protein